MCPPTSMMRTSNDPANPEQYKCEGRGCTVSCSHDGSYGGFIRVDGYRLCQSCAAAWQRVKENFFDPSP